jgi:hypothetical protein
MCAATQKAGHMTASDQSLPKRHFSLAKREPSTHERQALTWTLILAELDIGRTAPARAAPEADGASRSHLSRSALSQAGMAADLGALVERLPAKQACKIMVQRLALTHERG